MVSRVPRSQYIILLRSRYCTVLLPQLNFQRGASSSSSAAAVRSLSLMALMIRAAAAPVHDQGCRTNFILVCLRFVVGRSSNPARWTTKR